MQKQKQDFEFTTRSASSNTNFENYEAFKAAARDAGYLTENKVFPQNFSCTSAVPVEIVETSNQSLKVHTQSKHGAYLNIHNAVELTFGEKPSVNLLIDDVDKAAKLFWNAVAKVVGQPDLFPDIT